MYAIHDMPYNNHLLKFDVPDLSSERIYTPTKQHL